MARSSTDLRTGQRRLLLAGVMLSGALHLVLLGSAWSSRAWRVAAPAARPLVVAWVKAAAPAAKQPVPALAESMPVGITPPLPEPARAHAVDVESTPLAPALVAALPEVAASQPDSSAAAALPADTAASAAPAGIAFAPPRWGGFSGRWGRSAVPPRQEEDDVFAQQEAQRQSRRLAAQQQQAMAELAWRDSHPVPPPQAGW